MFLLVLFKEQTTQKANTTHLNNSSPLESQRGFCLTQRPLVFCRHLWLQKFSPNVCWTFQGIACQIPAERFASLKTNSGIWKVYHFNLKTLRSKLFTDLFTFMEREVTKDEPNLRMIFLDYTADLLCDFFVLLKGLKRSCEIRLFLNKLCLQLFRCSCQASIWYNRM